MTQLLPQPKEIALGGDSRVIFDHAVGYYRGKRYYSEIGNDRKRHYRSASAKADKIEHLFCSLFFQDIPNGPVKELLEYVRSTEWGAELP